MIEPKFQIAALPFRTAAPTGTGSPAASGESPEMPGFEALFAAQLGADAAAGRVAGALTGPEGKGGETVQPAETVPDLPALTGLSPARRTANLAAEAASLPDAGKSLPVAAARLAAKTARAVIGPAIGEWTDPAGREDKARGAAAPTAPDTAPDPVLAEQPAAVPVIEAQFRPTAMAALALPMVTGTAADAPALVQRPLARPANDRQPVEAAPASAAPAAVMAAPLPLAPGRPVDTQIAGAVIERDDAPMASAAPAAKGGPNAAKDTFSDPRTDQPVAVPTRADTVAHSAAAPHDRRLATETGPAIASLGASPNTPLHAAPLAPMAPPDPTAAAGDAPRERIDFATLVDSIARARDDAASGPVAVAVNHAEFGKVSLRFHARDEAVTVAMSSADPGFAPAVAAASRADAMGSEAETPRGESQQRAAAQPQGASGDGRAATQGGDAAPGSRGQSSGQHNPRVQGTSGRLATPDDAPGSDGIFA